MPIFIGTLEINEFEHNDISNKMDTNKESGSSKNDLIHYMMDNKEFKHFFQTLMKEYRVGKTGIWSKWGKAEKKRGHTKRV